MGSNQESIRWHVTEMGRDIIESERFNKARTVPHHTKRRSIADHSVDVAERALRMSNWLERHGVRVDGEEIVRAALLHDIGMTEDEVFFSPSRIKAYSHPREGVRIAREEFSANDIQVDAILRHMWPIGIVVPKHMTGWVVVVADKYTSVGEIRHEATRRGIALWRKRHGRHARHARHHR